MIAGFLLFLPSCRYLRKQFKIGEYSLRSVKEWARQDSIWVADSLKRVNGEKKSDVKPLPEAVKRELRQKKTFEKTLTDSLMSMGNSELRTENTGTRFYIIAGSFSTHDNASKIAAQYSAQGYTTLIIKSAKPGGALVEYVSVRTFTDHVKATQFLNDFKAKYDPGAWIFVGK
jgi:hypothetical protein